MMFGYGKKHHRGAARGGGHEAVPLKNLQKFFFEKRHPDFHASTANGIMKMRACVLAVRDLVHNQHLWLIDEPTPSRVIGNYG